MGKLRLVILLFAAAAGLARAQAACDWHDLLTEIDLREGKPSRYAWTAAMLGMAMFDAASAADPRYRTFQPLPPIPGPLGKRAAIAGAAHHLIVHAYPAARAEADKRLAEWLRDVPEDLRTRSIAFGASVARRLLAARADDEAKVADAYRPLAPPGQFVPPILPVGTVAAARPPFVLASVEAVRPPPPPSLASARYAKDYEEIRRRGEKSSVARGEEATRVANLLALSHPALFQSAVVRLARDRHLGELEAARLVALDAVALHDASLASFSAKYHYHAWRPITAIRNGDTDGNDATARDPTWTSLVESPVHPEYPCQHCVGAGVTMTVVRAFFPGEPVVLRIVRNGSPALEVPVDELGRVVAQARIDGGIHFRFSTEAGEALGRAVARQVVDTAARPLP